MVGGRGSLVVNIINFSWFLKSWLEKKKKKRAKKRGREKDESCPAPIMRNSHLFFHVEFRMKNFASLAEGRKKSRITANNRNKCIREENGKLKLEQSCRSVQWKSSIKLRSVVLIEPKSKPSVDDENMLGPAVFIVLEQYDVEAPISGNLSKWTRVVVVHKNHISKLITIISYSALANQNEIFEWVERE